jgi:hypothetical protein
MWWVRIFLCYSGCSVVEVGAVYSCVGISMKNKMCSICDVVSENPQMFDPAEYVLFP